MMSASAADVKGLSKSLVNEYKKSATTQTQIVDLFLVFILMTGVLQFLYCVLVGSFPFNSFLSGFLSCVGMFALTGTFFLIHVYVCVLVCALCVAHGKELGRGKGRALTCVSIFLTCQLTRLHPYTTKTVSLRLQISSEKVVEKAFGEYVFCCLLLFFVVFNFIG